MWSYLAEEASDSVATEFLSHLVARFSQVSALPLSGVPRPLLAPVLRVIFQGKYAIYYLPRLDEIVIVRVPHSSRDIATVAEEGGFAV